MSRIRIERPAASRLPVRSTYRICASDAGAGTEGGAVVVRGPGTLSADASTGLLMPPTPNPDMLRCVCRQRGT
ncbi:hypothetical protein GCM10010280_56830 [Streptomyces pilosus]|uniref:Uncharacterized protein n=1 Tax=Streptomyces pilosus TaxID=28893 RepID=A0A918F295_9ACTN|nr:hypothetical protein GCM10010280_56830 [Streptomyces pilosus]